MPYEYTGEEPYFGLSYPEAGNLGDDRDEAERTIAIGRLFQAAYDALGRGVIEGGVASQGVGLVAITPVNAIIPDDIGCVPCQHDATEIALGEFAEGDNYIYLQLDETAREDGSCGYLVDPSDEAPARSLVIALVVVSGGEIESVDNTVKDVPAIAARIPWEVLQRSYDDATSLLDTLRGGLGDRYLGDEVPDDLDTRVTALETGGGGEGGGVVYWGDLRKSAGDATTVLQAIIAAIAQHVVDEHGAGESGGGATIQIEQFDSEAVNQAIAVIEVTAALDADHPAEMVDCAVIVWGRWGDGTDETPDYVDRDVSTWLPEE